MSHPVELGVLRTRLVNRAVADRRRFERALHDGVQQDLVAMVVRVQLARELLEAEPAAALDLLEEIRRDARDALERLRALAGEIYPSILDSRGLPDAIREAGRTAAASVRAEIGTLGRYPSEIEAAVYFVCSCVLDSARPGTNVAVAVRESDGELHLEIESGSGADPATLEDLVQAAGGTLAVEPASNGGVRLRAAIPLDRPDYAGSPSVR